VLKVIREWKKLREETLAKGYGKELRKTIFLDPKGKEVDFYLYGQKNWAIILPLTMKGEVVAIRQYYQGANKILLTIPGGDLNSVNEKPEDAIKRELMEETGYLCQTVERIGETPLWPSTRNSWAHYWTFIGLEAEKKKEQNLDQFEEIEIETIPFKKWIELCETEIEDNCAVTATFRALGYLKRNNLLEKYLP